MTIIISSGAADDRGAFNTGDDAAASEPLQRPGLLSATETAERAIGHYSVACAPCHAAPGHPAAPWMVLYPAPADLTKTETVARWTDAELFWIIQNGIKDSSMIALGPTHREQDI